MTKNRTRKPDAIRAELSKARARQAGIAARGAALEESEKGKTDGASLAIKARMHSGLKRHWDAAHKSEVELVAELAHSIGVHGANGVGGLK
jgi:2,4-dienoyl-CoA reductase-like NADH-dependent reductase (Old Yellow Enzyme family)